jgi:hypothetical protein
VVLADSIAPLVTSLYGQAALGSPMSLVPGWMAAIGFTLQIYFDFSGYTDMALGLGRFFGIRFPPNFNSPLRASNIIDFWQRWHMTLTRFLTAYIYNPWTLRVTRRRAAQGRPGFGGRQTTIGAFAEVLMFPTLVTMFVAGVWHGAGYLFALWGLLHGVYLTINHAWRLNAARSWRDRASYDRVMKPIGFVVTFVAVAAGMVLFRSPTMTAASGLLKGMLGLNGVALPAPLYDRVGRLPAWVHPENATVLGYGDFQMLTIWILVLGFIALALPNTLQVLSRYEPALGVKPIPSSGGFGAGRFAWKPSVAWAIAVTVVAAIGILHLGGNSEFLYWQF